MIRALERCPSPLAVHKLAYPVYPLHAARTAGGRSFAPMTIRVGRRGAPAPRNAMTSITTTSSFTRVPSLETAWQDVDSSFERFCLTAGIGAIEQVLCEDAQQLAGMPHSRDESAPSHSITSSARASSDSGTILVIGCEQRRVCWARRVLRRIPDGCSDRH
jgi:hypothetical protein